MQTRAKVGVACSVGLAWLVAGGLVGGCAAMFDIEPASGVSDGAEEREGAPGEPALRSGESSDEPTSTGGSGQAEALPGESAASGEETSGEETSGASGEEAPGETIELEQQLPAQREPEQGVNLAEEVQAFVPGGSEQLPPNVGLSGANVYSLAARGSTMSVAVTESGFCVEGTATLLRKPGSQNADYITSWGTALKVYTASWRPGDSLVEGLSFEIVGEIVPEMRFQGFAGPTGYCVPLDGSEGAVLFGDLRQECYSGAGNNPLFTDQVMTAFEWQVFSAPRGPKPFDFCVQNIQPIFREAATQAP